MVNARSGITGASAVDSYFECINSERFDQLIELFTPDAALDAPGTKPRRGRDQIRDYYTRAFAPYAEHLDEVTRTIREASSVVVEVHFHGALASGAALEFDAVDVFDLDDEGAIERLTSWYDSHWVRSLMREAAPPGP